MPSNYNRRISLYINGKEVKYEIASISNEMKKIVNQQARMTIGSKEYNAAASDIKKLRGILQEHYMGLKNTESATSKLSKTFQSLMPALGVAAVVGFFKNIGTQIFSVQEKFQTFAAVLKTALGSKGAALASMQMIQDFAAKTPFSVEGLTNSFIKLVNRGFKPTKEELTKMGDLASASGKDFDQLVEAILDAETGEFERLKEFGIKAKVSGDQVTLSFKGVKTTIDNNAESLRAYLLSLGETNGVMGSMAEISNTLAGKTSNLGDSWTTLLKTLGDSNGGVFSSVISGLTNIVNAANLAYASVSQIKANVEINSASENVKESFKEIDFMTSKLVSRGVALNNAKKQAYELYMAERNNQLNNLSRDIATTDAQLKSYTSSISYSLKVDKAVYDLAKRKEWFELKKRMLTDEVEQIKTLKDAEIDFTKQVVNYAKLSTKELNQLIKKGDELAKSELEKRKTANEGLKDAFQELSKHISEIDKKINNAIAAHDIPLVKKFTLEKQAAELLLEAYKKVKEAYEKGFDMDQRDMGPLAMMVAKKAGVVTSNKPGISKPIDKVDSGGGPADPESGPTEEEINSAIKNTAIQAAQDLNDTIFEIVRNRRQKEFDLAMSVIEKERQTELSNKHLTEAQKDAINKKYDAKANALKLKQFKQEQKLSVSMAFMNGALAIVKAFADLGPILGAIAAAGIIITTGLQIASIKSQPPPVFYEGGYTSKSGNNRNPAGIVHDNEYVIPAVGLQNPSIGSFVNDIEFARQRGNLPTLNMRNLGRVFNNGGFTSSESVAFNTSNKSLSRLQGISDTDLIKAFVNLEKTVQALNERIKAPIQATVAIRGRNGFNEKLAEDQQSTKNASL